MTTRLADGDAAPAFTLPDADGNEVSLADYAGQRVILYFYPAAMTPGCTTQAVDFTAAMAELTAAGLHVLGVSPDTQEKLIQFRDQQSVAFPLLSDVDKKTLSAYGAYGEKLLYGKLVEGVIRSTFVIDVDQAGRGPGGGGPVQREGHRARGQAQARVAGVADRGQNSTKGELSPSKGALTGRKVDRWGVLAQRAEGGTRTLTPEGTGT